MRLFARLSLGCVCVLLVSCSDGRPSSCLGESKMGKSFEGFSETDKFFVKTDFNRYVGAALGDLAKDFPVKYEKRVGLTESPTRLVGIEYTFPNNFSANIYLSETKYTKWDETTRKWNFGKIGKEKITGIRIKHRGTNDYYCQEFGDMK